jgi:DNA modification methylase
VALVERAIRNSSKHRDIVLDPFGGSGTTMIAAERTGRQAVLLEIDPAYVDVIVRRWEEATGQNALLDGGDQNFGAATAIRRSMVVGAAAT